MKIKEFITLKIGQIRINMYNLWKSFFFEVLWPVWNDFFLKVSWDLAEADEKAFPKKRGKILSHQELQQLEEERRALAEAKANNMFEVKNELSNDSIFFLILQIILRIFEFVSPFFVGLWNKIVRDIIVKKIFVLFWACLKYGPGLFCVNYIFVLPYVLSNGFYFAFGYYFRALERKKEKIVYFF